MAVCWNHTIPLQLQQHFYYKVLHFLWGKNWMDMLGKSWLKWTCAVPVHHIIIQWRELTHCLWTWFIAWCDSCWMSTTVSQYSAMWGTVKDRKTCILYCINSIQTCCNICPVIQQKWLLLEAKDPKLQTTLNILTLLLRTGHLKMFMPFYVFYHSNSLPSLITLWKSILTIFCSSQVLCGSASWFTLFDNIGAGTIGLPIPVEHLALFPGTCEDLLDSVAQNLVKTLILHRRNHAAHSRGVSPQKGSIRASSPGGGPASTHSPNTGPRPWGQTRGTQALWTGGIAAPKGLSALHFLPAGGIFYLHRIPHWYPTEARPVGREKGARGAPADS